MTLEELLDNIEDTNHKFDYLQTVLYRRTLTVERQEQTMFQTGYNRFNHQCDSMEIVKSHTTYKYALISTVGWGPICFYHPKCCEGIALYLI